MLSAIGILFAFGIVIFVHEFGHFIVAKKSGVKVERFSFGLGPEMFGFKWGETRYCVAWLPLGGEVRMAGEMVESDGNVKVEPSSQEDTSRHFFSQPWYRRVLIAFAGPFMNYVLAILIFFTMLMYWGEAVQTNKTEIGEVMAGMPADKAGLQKGDRVVSVQGEPVDDFISLASKIHVRPDMATDIAFVRAGQEMKVSIIPQRPEGKGPGLIGIKPAEPIVERNKLGPIDATKKAVWQCWNISAFTVYSLYNAVKERQKIDVAGPLGIGQVISKAVKSGMEDYLYLIAMISVAIGLFNLFPIPMLDGGHVLYYVIEGIRGKPLSMKVMGKANVVGLALLLSLLVFATFNDIQRFNFFKKKSPAPVTETTEPLKEPTLDVAPATAK